MESGAVTLNANTKYFLINVDDSDNAKFVNLQIEQGTTATPYEQHLESQITANIPAGEFMGKTSKTYKDTLKVKFNEEDEKYHLILNKIIGKVVFDGNENWTTQTRFDGKTKFFVLNKNTIETSCSNTETTGCELSNRFIQNNPYQHIGDYIWKFVNADADITRIGFSDDTIDSVEKLKTWLSENNTELYYPLAKPYEIDLGIVEMPSTYDGITNIFTDSDLLPQISVKYYRSLKKIVQDLNMQNKSLEDRISAIEELLGTTQTSALLLDNMQTDLESEV